VDDENHRDLLSTKENPFLKGRLASASRINSHGNTLSPRNMLVLFSASKAIILLGKLKVKQALDINHKNQRGFHHLG